MMVCFQAPVALNRRIRRALKMSARPMVMPIGGMQCEQPPVTRWLRAMRVSSAKESSRVRERRYSSGVTVYQGE